MGRSTGHSEEGQRGKINDHTKANAPKRAQSRAHFTDANSRIIDAIESPLTCTPKTGQKGGLKVAKRQPVIALASQKWRANTNLDELCLASRPLARYITNCEMLFLKKSGYESFPNEK